MDLRLRRGVALTLCSSLLASIPGTQAWAAAAREVSAPSVPAADLGLKTGISVPRLPAALPGVSDISANGGNVAVPAALQAAPVAAPAGAMPRGPLASPGAPLAVAALQAAAPAAQKAAAAAALPQARAASEAAAPILNKPGSSAGDLRQAAAAAFDATAPSVSGSADAVFAEGDGAVASPSLLAAPSAAAPRRARVVPAVAAARRLLNRASAAISARPLLQKTLALAAVAAAAVVMPHAVSTLALPLVMGTCNAMRERAIKDATILPQNKEQSDKAKKELDRILVEFGKRVKAAADGDDRVTTEISAHSAEHAMEEPLLEILPELKGLWASGAATTKEEALAQMKAAVLEELKRRFPNESPEVVEELFEKTGAWKEILDWEARHQVLDELKKAAKQDPQGTLNELQVIRQAEGQQQSSGSRGGMGGMGGAALGIALVAGLTLAHVALGPAVGAALAFVAVAGVLQDAPPPAPPVDLDTYLGALGLSKDEADFLKGFTIDLGARDMAPVIGRSKELRRAITILSKPAGTQNNPMVLGDKGVGKTAIVEAIARYLYLNRLPSLKGKRILELDSGKLTAGTGVQGEMEKRLTMLRTILAKTDNKVILFVDEIHSILKNTATSNSVPDLLKSPLRNGEMTVIGATTVGEYRKYVEQDPAFADRFDTIQVNEPSEDEATEMIEGDLEYLERKFGVTIAPEAAKAAVKLSSRYIPEKFLPRKARQLLESAIADAKPEAQRDGLQVQVDQMTDRLRILVKRYAELRKKAVADPALKGALKGSPSGEEIAAYNRIVSVYTSILALEDQRGAIVEQTIGKEQIVRTLAKETGIPVGDVDGDEYERLMRMEPWFKERIVNQDDAIKALADAVRTNKAGLSDPNRPQGVFLFAGKTGVGKTALTRALAEYLFSDPDAVTRLDMSEYMEKFAVQRLFGAPPGYVGYDAGGELTEKVRRKPYQVVLFDEIEKAHPDVLNALLQVFDAGRMTDGRQNTVNFKNTIIIMTTNLGAKAGGEGDEFKRRVVEQIRQRLSPEFYNRIDKTVVFNPLDVTQAEAITAIMLKDVEKRLREQDLDLRVSPEALKLLAAKGFDPELGARPLKRVVETDITNALSPFLLAKKAEGELANGGVIEVTAEDVDLAAKTGRIEFTLKPNPAVAAEPAPLPAGPLGEKLRRILEQAAAGEGVAGDMETFEGALFPERRAVKLDKPLGAFRAESAPALPKDADSRLLATEQPGVKDAVVKSLKAELAEGFSGEAQEQAFGAWLDAFTRAAKELSPREKPEVRLRKSRDGSLTVYVEAKADAGYAAVQKLSRKAADHFTAPLPDEAALRARAASLKDEGREADLSWLEAKRAVEAVAGSQFGFSSEEKDGGSWRFWLTLPAGSLKASGKKAAAAAETGARSSAEPDAKAEKAASKEAPIPVNQARSTPAKMFQFLTQRGPAQMSKRRALISEMLDSKSTEVRLTGLIMAAAVLPTGAWRELAASVRMLRLDSMKDYALFSALVERHPESPMTAQRKALMDSYESALRALRGEMGRDRYGVDSTAQTARRYAGLAAPLAGSLSREESRAVIKAANSTRARFRRIGWTFALATTPVVAGAIWLASHYAWHPFWAVAVPLALAGISLWIFLGNYGDIRSRGPRDAAYYEAANFGRLDPKDRVRVARSWLDAASRGRGPFFSAEQEAAFLTPVLQTMSEGEKTRIFRRWRKSLEKALAKVQAKPSSNSPEILNTMGLLARLLPSIPDSERDACARALLLPLRGRWLPSGTDDYLQGLGAWLANAPVSDEELDELLGVVTNFPSSRQAGLMSFIPVLQGIARRPSLPSGVAAGMEQAFSIVAGESAQNRQPAQVLELARLRAKLGARNVWPTLKEFVESTSASWDWEAFSVADELINEDPPSEQDQEWLLKALRNRRNRDGEANAFASLTRANLDGSADDRLEAALRALSELTVDNDPAKPALEPTLIDAVGSLAGSPLDDKTVREAWEAAVRENAARLEKSR